MESTLIQPGQEVEVTCEVLFLCGSIVMDATEFRLTTNVIFVSSDAMIKTADKPKASSGRDGTRPGAAGDHGADGAAGGNLVITANEKLPGSADTLIFESKGGYGGDGGNGRTGEDKTGDVPTGPATARDVCEHGTEEGHTHDSDHRCGKHCYTYDDYWYFRMTIHFVATGGDGGHGGHGGERGAAGLLTILGSSGVTAVNYQHESVGGLGGTGGAGGPGVDADREWLAWYNRWKNAGCCGVFGTECCQSTHENWGGYQYFNHDTPLYGKSGSAGSSGTDWVP